MIDTDSCDDINVITAAPELATVIDAILASGKMGKVSLSYQQDKEDEPYIILTFMLHNKKQNVRLWL